MKQLLETLDLALAALEESVDLVREDYENAKKLYSNYPSRQARLIGLEDGLSKHEAAITAIKQARSSPVQEPAIKQGWDVDTLLDRPAAPYVASPLVQDTEAHYKGVIEGVQKLFNDKRAQPAPVQEPVEKHYVDGGHIVYPAAQRQWVGLTDEERVALWKATETDNRMVLINAVEAKLKEKNT
jgi:hypothetical protein